MKNYLAGLVVCSLVLANCGPVPGLMEGLKDVQAVQTDVVRAVHEDNVTVNLNNDRYLTISLINSPIGALATEPKEAKAREIAQIAFLAFPHRERLEQIGVVFMEQRRYFFFFNYSNGTDAHFFKASEFAPASKASFGG